MNRIVRDHYPVKKLPEDLQEGLPMDGIVRIVVEEDTTAAGAAGAINRKPLTAEEAIDGIKRFKSLGLKSLKPNEAVERIRKLRDEWDSE